MAAQIEKKIVFQRNQGSGEQFLPEGGQLFFEVPWGQDLAHRITGATAWNRQSLAIEFTAGLPWKIRNRLDQRWDHVSGQPLSQAGAEDVLVHRVVIPGNDIGGELRETGHILAQSDGGG